MDKVGKASKSVKETRRGWHFEEQKEKDGFFFSS